MGIGVGKSDVRSLLFQPVWTLSQSVSSSSQSCCHALSSEIKHNVFSGVTSFTSVLCWQPDLSIKYYPWSEGIHSGDCLHTLFKGVGAKSGATWELIRGLGILVYPSPPGWAYLQPTSSIRRIFTSLHME